jgi:hypothetical protein
MVHSSHPNGGMRFSSLFGPFWSRALHYLHPFCSSQMPFAGPRFSPGSAHRPSHFSIRPLLVKGFALSTPVLLQSDAFRRASLLSGIGPSALPLWDAWDEAAQSMGRSDRAPAAGTSASTSSPDPPSCEGRLSSARWRNSGYLTVSDEGAR